MSLDGMALAQLLQPHLGDNDPQTGAPNPTPQPALVNYAKGYVAMLKAALVAFILPGTIQGAAIPPGGPLSGGMGSGGKILTALGPVMFGVASGGVAPLALPGLTAECTAIATYLMASAAVSFAPGNVTGNSTASPPPANTPGPLVAGAAVLGTISGLNGGPLAQLVTGATGQTGPKQVEFYTALCNYTQTSAQVTFAANTVLGTCTGTGQFILGLAAGGTIA